MEQITLLGRKRKEGTLVSEFEPQESDEIMLNLIKRIRNVLQSDLKELREHDGNRLKEVTITAEDDSFNARITHIPVDYFGEKDAEIRAVLTIKSGDKHPAIQEAINGQEFEVSVTG